MGRTKSRWRVINPPPLRPNKAPCIPNKATNEAIAATRSVEPCTPRPEPVAVLRTSKHRPHGCRSTKTYRWLATQTNPKGAQAPKKTNMTRLARKALAVTAIFPSQVATASRRVSNNPSPNPSPSSSKRALQRLRRTQVRKHHERLHSRRRLGSLYRTDALLTDPSKAVIAYARLLAHNRSRRQSVADEDKEAEVVGFDKCINVPVMDVNTVYGHIYYAYYMGKRDEYSRVPEGIG